jgi:signal transduction histidine kinase/CheY-like chemotaxis protein
MLLIFPAHVFAYSTMNEPGPKNENDDVYLLREKFFHIIKAARSATAANILAPLLCVPVFRDEVRAPYFDIWLSYMAVVVLIRTILINKIWFERERSENPQSDLRKITFAVAIVGLGWGLGWPLMAPDLSMVNRMIYVYMTTAAMISSMFAYSVNRPTFYWFTLPIMLPAVSTILWPNNIFPWPFLIGMTALYAIVLSIARNFSMVFSNSVKLRFGNETLYRELANERDQSVAANMAKSKFIAAASHDLRQPLHAVNINISLLNVADLKVQDANVVRRIKNSVSVLNGMFESLLDMSKLESDVAKSEVKYFLLSDLAGSIQDVVEHRAADKGLVFSINTPKLAIRGDQFLLQQLLINLVLNAIQYTHAGSVDVEFRVKKGLLAVDVTDTGVGILPAEMDSIFNEFYRVESTRRNHEGLGLGLSIVKKICKLIDASIEVNSVPGQGSVFTLTTAYPVEMVPDRRRTEVSTNAPEVHVNSKRLEGKVIAIVEDDLVIADAYKATLRNQGAEILVLPERDEELASQLKNAGHIDCILSDFQLEKATGDQVIGKIRKALNSEVPAVIVTGDTSKNAATCGDLAHALILYKPVTLNKIIHSIETVMQAS